MVKILVMKSDLILKNKEGLDPLELASKLKHSEVFNILYEELNAREERAKTNSKEIYEEATKKEKKEKNILGILSESTSPIQTDIYERDENDYFSDKENTPISNKVNDNLQSSIVNISQKNLFEGNYKNIQYPPNYYPHPNQGYIIGNSNNNNNNNLMNVSQMQGFYGQNMAQNYPSNLPNSFQGGQNINSKKGQNFAGNSFNNQSNANNNIFPNNNPSSFNNPSYNYNMPNVNSKKNLNPPSGINLHLADNNKVVITKTIPNYSNYSINIPFDFNYKKLKGEHTNHSTGQLGEYISIKIIN